MSGSDKEGPTSEEGDQGPAGNFVFGQNMADRVWAATAAAAPSPASTGDAIRSPVKKLSSTSSQKAPPGVAAFHSGSNAAGSTMNLSSKFAPASGRPDGGDVAEDGIGDDGDDDDGDDDGGDDGVAAAEQQRQMSSEEIFGHTVPKSTVVELAPPPSRSIVTASSSLSSAVPSRPFGGAGVQSTPPANPFGGGGGGGDHRLSSPGVVSSTTPTEDVEYKSGVADSTSVSSFSSSSLHAEAPTLRPSILQPPTLSFVRGSGGGASGESGEPEVVDGRNGVTSMGAERKNFDDQKDAAKPKASTDGKVVGRVDRGGGGGGMGAPMLMASTTQTAPSAASTSFSNQFGPQRHSSPFSLTRNASSSSSSSSSLFKTASTTAAKPLLRPSALDPFTVNWVGGGSKSALSGNSSTPSSFVLEPPTFGGVTALPSIFGGGRSGIEEDDREEEEEEKAAKSAKATSKKKAPDAVNGEKKNDSLSSDSQSTTTTTTAAATTTTTTTTTTGGTFSNAFGSFDTSSSSSSSDAETTNYFAIFLKEQTEARRGGAGGATTSPPANSASSSFVFGENLQSRVVPGAVTRDEPSSNDIDDRLPLVTSSSSADASSSKTLSQAAAEFQAQAQASSSSAANFGVAAADMRTGEEGETNVKQITCRMYRYTSSRWEERGCGLLRLNDIPQRNGSFKSRLVMRLQGSQRVILNTSVWSGMAVVRASPKCIRLTCLDEEGKSNIHLFQSTVKDTEALFEALKSRIHEYRQSETEGTHRDASGGGGAADAASADFQAELPHSSPSRSSGATTTTITSPPTSSSVAEGEEEDWDAEQVTSTSTTTTTTNTMKRSAEDGDNEEEEEEDDDDDDGCLRSHRPGASSNSTAVNNASTSAALSVSSSSSSSASTAVGVPAKRRKPNLPAASSSSTRNNLEPAAGVVSSGGGGGGGEIHPILLSRLSPRSGSADGGRSIGGRNSSASMTDSHHDSETSTPPDPETEVSNESHTSSVTNTSLSE